MSYVKVEKAAQIGSIVAQGVLLVLQVAGLFKKPAEAPQV